MHNQQSTHVRDGDALDVDLQGLEHGLCVLVDLDVLDVDGGALRNEVHAALALLLLQLQGDAAHWATLDALHQVLQSDTQMRGERRHGLSHSTLSHDAGMGKQRTVM